MNNKTTENLFQSAPLYGNKNFEGENADVELVELQVENTFGAVTEKEKCDIGVNGWAMVWLSVFIVSVGGLIYRVRDAVLVQDLINKVVAGSESAIRFGKNTSVSLMGGELPTVPTVSMMEQISFIMSGVVLLSLLGLLWSILARSGKYKNKYREMRGLQKGEDRLRAELLILVDKMHSVTVALEQTTDGTASLFAELLAGQSKQSREAARQLQRLGENAQQIDTFVHTMQDVAEQTNIAVLNASIQTATGEAGHRFASITEEMKRLTTLSGSVAYEINVRIKSRQQEVASVIAFIESTAEADAANQVDGESEEAQPSNEQTNSQPSTSWDLKMSEVRLALEQMKSVTQKLKQRIA